MVASRWGAPGAAATGEARPPLHPCGPRLRPGPGPGGGAAVASRTKGRRRRRASAARAAPPAPRRRRAASGSRTRSTCTTPPDLRRPCDSPFDSDGGGFPRTRRAAGGRGGHGAGSRRTPADAAGRPGVTRKQQAAESSPSSAPSRGQRTARLAPAWGPQRPASSPPCGPTAPGLGRVALAVARQTPDAAGWRCTARDGPGRLAADCRLMRSRFLVRCGHMVGERQERRWGN
jgi:hypothetical protein